MPGIRGRMGSYLKHNTYATCKKPSIECGELHQKLLCDMRTSSIYRPHDKQCGYRQGRIRLNNGYRCATASQRVISTWSSANGPTNGGSQPLPGKCWKEQQRKRQSREKCSLRKSKCPRDQEWAKTSQHRQMKGQRRQGPRRGRRRIHSRPRNNRNRLRERRRPPQIPTHRNQGEIRDQPRRQEVRARNQRHNEHRQNI
jgi:hypothetical protein